MHEGGIIRGVSGSLPPKLSIKFRYLSEFNGAAEGHQTIVFNCFSLSISDGTPLSFWPRLSGPVLNCPGLSTTLGWIFRGIQNAGDKQANGGLSEKPPCR